MQESYGSKSTAKLVGTVVAVLVVAGIVLIADHMRAKSTSTTVAQTTPTTTSQTAVATAAPAASTTSNSGTASTSPYKDGTYSASSDYYVPHGNESIKVTLTIKNGVITNSSLVNSEGDRDSAAYQEDFSATYKNYVVGKSVSSLSLSRIAGASDTTQGFDDAVQQIATQAKA